MSSQYQDDQEWLDYHEKKAEKNAQEIKELKKYLKQYQNNEICMTCHEHIDTCSQIGRCL